MRVRIVASRIAALVVAGPQPAVAASAWVMWNRHRSRATDDEEREDWRLILSGVIYVKIAVIETRIRTETFHEKPIRRCEPTR
jgi:hypothetical protein